MRFLRNTHVNGVFRKELEDKRANPPLVLHMLSSDTPSTFDELCQLVWQYECDNHEISSSLANQLAFQLVRLLEHDMAKVVP